MVRKVDSSAMDAVTVAVLRATERKRIDREVLGEMSQREQARVFAAEARHANRTNKG